MPGTLDNFFHAKSLQSGLTVCDPVDYSCLDLLCMEFSRQEYWNGLPFQFLKNTKNYHVIQQFQPWLFIHKTLKTVIQKDICTPMFIRALSIIAKI